MTRFDTATVAAVAATAATAATQACAVLFECVAATQRSLKDEGSSQ
jgi:hypothetical protein